MKSESPNNYQNIVNALKSKIRQARLQAAYKLNADLLGIYWEIGKTISEQEQLEKWGAKIVDNLSKDLKSEFEDMRGLSPRNLRYMRDFALAYPHFPFLQAPLAKIGEIIPFEIESSILQAPLAKLSWWHHITLLDKVKDPETRLFYILNTIENGWSRDVMVYQIEGSLDKRKGQLSNNFKQTIPHEQSELVQQVFKDPYKFDFIYLGKKAKERDLEEALTTQLTKFLLELGQNFSFMGRQYKMVLGEKEYFFDLLFYHTKLKRYIIIELKIGEFKPEYTGKMGLYLTLADEQLKDETDEKSIGLILCKTKDRLVAEYALRDTRNPIGIAEYKIIEALPENIKGELPSIEEIEQTMEDEIKDLRSEAEKRLGILKEKLASMNNPEVKVSASFEILVGLYDNGIKPFFDALMIRLKDFDQYFLSTYHFWMFEKKIDSLNEFGQYWKDKIKINIEPQFTYWFRGFKKGGVKTFDTSVTISFSINEYWYGFKLINYNNNEPFLKKLYDQPLTKEDVNFLCDVICETIINNMEAQINALNL